MTKLTKIDYLYRDASNYKFHGSFIVRGLMSRKQLEPFLFDGEFFIPTMIGLPHLLNMASNDDDHDFHELSDFTEIETGTADFDASDLLVRFKEAKAKNWSPPVFQYHL